MFLGYVSLVYKCPAKRKEGFINERYIMGDDNEFSGYNLFLYNNSI